MENRMKEAALIIPIFALAIPMVIVPTSLVLRHLRERRQWQHVERLKALEMGRSLPGHDIWVAKAATAIGAVMPVGVFGVAWLASQTSRSGEEAWVAATVVGLTGVVSGSRLARRLLDQPRVVSNGPSHLANGKPQFDPEGYDFAGRRV
jgi:hypothetical protein